MLRIIALLLLATPALATQIEADQAPCPLGGAPAQVFKLISKNGLGGWDSDGATYSSQGQFRTWEVSTCPNYPLSLYGRDMARGLSEDELARVRPVVEQLEVEYPDPSTVEPWQRYVMAARVYEALGRDALYVARVYLKGSWTIRDEAVGEIKGLHGPLVQRRLLLAGEAELQRTDLTAAQRKVLLFNLARASHRAGHHALTDRYMGLIREVGELDQVETLALAKLEDARTKEPVLQEQAMAHLTRVIDGRYTPEQKAQARYLMADLLRRTGRDDLALAAYDKAAADRKAPEVVRQLSTYMAAELRGEKPWEGVEGNPFATPWTP